MTASSAADLRDELFPPAQTETFEEEPDQEEDELQALELPLWNPPLRVRISEAWRSRHLVSGMARSAVPTYRGKILGRAWHVIRPLWQVFGMALIFGGIFHATAPNSVPYVLFVVFNYQAFQLFRITVMYETVGGKLVKVVRNLRVPLLLLPLAILGRVFIRLGIYWAIAVGTLLYYWIAKGHLYLVLGPKLLVGLAGTALALAFGLALGLITGVLYPRAKDMKYFVRYLMGIWVFVTPVYYSVHQLPGWAQTVAQFNPMAGIVNMVQYGFLDAGALKPFGVLWSLGSLVVTGAFGLWFYNKFATRWIGVYRTPEDDDDDTEDAV
jgi:ABC-type polysaccharide/polyol phosphate export permease